MNERVKGTVKQFETISASLPDTLERGKQINMAIASIASVSHETAARVEEAISSVAQANHSVDEISANADSLY